jgi:hypothetical protein
LFVLRQFLMILKEVLVWMMRFEKVSLKCSILILLAFLIEGSENA